MKSWARNKKNIYVERSGFTIVELLIVIIVIGILATLVLVAYSNVSDQAKSSAAKNDLEQVAKQLNLYKENTGGGTSYPADTSSLSYSSGTTIQYSVNNSVSPATYCVTAANGNKSFWVSSTSQTPTAGGCPGHGVNGQSPITNLAANPSFENNTSNWSSNGTNTIASSADYKFSGAKSMKIVTTGTTNVGTLSGFTLDASTTYTFTGYVYLPASFGSGLRMCVWGNPINGNSLTCQSYVTTIGSWVRSSYTATTTAAGNINLYFYNGNGDAATGAIAYVDAVMVTKTSSVQNYADGDSANWIWNGTTGNSTSTGPAL